MRCLAACQVSALASCSQLALGNFSGITSDSVAPEHLSERDIEQHRWREASPADLLRVTHHVADCSSCREIARRVRLASAQARSVCGGSPDSAGRRPVTAHLSQCKSCAEDVKYLETLGRQPAQVAVARLLAPQPPLPPG